MRSILIVASYSAPYGGNFIASVKLLAEKMIEMKNNVLFALPDDTKNITWSKMLSKEFKTFYIPKPYKSIENRIIKQIKQIIREQSIDVVYSHFTGYDMDCFFACGKKTKLVLHMHNPINNTEKDKIRHRIRAKIKWHIFSHKVYVIACASHLLDYVSSMGYDISDSTYVLNGIDVERIEKIVPTNPYCYNDGENNILMHGWDPYRKGVDIAIAALKNVREKAHLYITYVDKSMVEAFITPLLDDASKLKVTLLPAVENVMDYLVNVDIFISPSRAEGSPYALMEAILAGKPSIGTNLPGLDWQKEIPALWTIDSEDTNALSRTIDEIASMGRRMLDNKIIEAKAIIVKKHSSDTWADTVTKYFVEKVL